MQGERTAIISELKEDADADTGYTIYQKIGKNGECYKCGKGRLYCPQGGVYLDTCYECDHCGFRWNIWHAIGAASEVGPRKG